MPHEMGRCPCGKRRHWPKHSKIGDKWKCRRCGRITTLVAAGTPGASHTKTVRSKHVLPSGKSTFREPKRQRHHHATSHTTTRYQAPPKPEASGCLVAVVFISVTMLAAATVIAKMLF